MNKLSQMNLFLILFIVVLLSMIIVTLSHIYYLCDPVSETLYFNAIIERNYWKFVNYQKTPIRVEMII